MPMHSVQIPAAPIADAARSRHFEQHVLPYLDAAYGLARWLARSEHDAEDVLQEAMLRAYRYYDLRGRDNVRAWLLTIVRNTFYTLRAQVPVASLVDEFDETIHGAGDDAGPQVFLTTHSPVVVRELRARELAIAHYDPIFDAHFITNVAGVDTGLDTQGLVRRCAEAFLATAVIVAEGPTEMGLIRGLDHFWVSQRQDPLALQGIAVADGGGIPQAAARAAAFAKLGYRTLLLMDDDRPLTATERAPVDREGAQIISWGNAHATEDALFLGMAWPDIQALMAIAEEIWGNARLNENMRSYSDGGIDLATCLSADTPAHRELLARAAKGQDWFKRIDFGERVGQEVLGPGWARATPALQATVEQLYTWSRGGPEH